MARTLKTLRQYCVLLSLCVLLGAVSGFVYASPGYEELKEKIGRYIGHSCLRSAEWGMKIVSLRTGDTIIDYRGDKSFIPASNVKVITTAAALSILRPQYRFRTVVYADGPLAGASLAGNLYVKGSGDPDLVSEQLWLLAKDIYNAGVRSIEGDVVGDESFFDDDCYGPGWKVTSSRAYNAGVGALSLNFNTIRVVVEPADEVGQPPRVVLDPDTSYVVLANNAVTVRRGSRCTLWADRMTRHGKDSIVVGGQVPLGWKAVDFSRTIGSPCLYTVTVLAEMLRKMGVEIQGRARVGLTPPDARELVVHESRPLALIVWGLNKWSNNFVAEQLFKTMGAERYGPPGTFAKGKAAVAEFLSGLGVSANEHAISDGSGLSRLNRISAGAIVDVLVHMYRDFAICPEFVTSLAVMGLDGSVEERLTGSPVEGLARVKTGTLNGVSSLSGYAEGKDGEVFAFAILMNDLPCGQHEARKIQDGIALLLAGSPP